MNHHLKSCILTYRLIGRLQGRELDLSPVFRWPGTARSRHPNLTDTFHLIRMLDRTSLVPIPTNIPTNRLLELDTAQECQAEQVPTAIPKGDLRFNKACNHFCGANRLVVLKPNMFLWCPPSMVCIQTYLCSRCRDNTYIHTLPTPFRNTWACRRICSTLLLQINIVRQCQSKASTGILNFILNIHHNRCMAPMLHHNKSTLRLRKVSLRPFQGRRPLVDQ